MSEPEQIDVKDKADLGKIPGGGKKILNRVMAAVFDRLRSVIVVSFVFCLLVCFFLPIFILKTKMTVRCEKGFLSFKFRHSEHH